MEETRTTIHAGLMRRNNFLRENPNFFEGQIFPISGITTGMIAPHAQAK